MSTDNRLSRSDFSHFDTSFTTRTNMIKKFLFNNSLVEFWSDQWKALAAIITVFLGCYFLPVGYPRFDNAVMESLYLVKWYAQEHVLLCLVPAFLIAGAIGVFVSQEGVMKYLGPTASRWIAYPVASVSGTVLAVCSCTILPLFAGIWTRGAGLGPASAFLYSGPAINVLAIILTARVLGMDVGIARAVGAIGFSVIIGLLMQLIFWRDEAERTRETMATMGQISDDDRPLWQTVIYFGLMVGILVFANWGKPDTDTGLWFSVYSSKWFIVSILGIAFSLVLVAWFGFSAIKMGVSVILVAVAAWFFRGDPLVPFTVGFAATSVIASSSPGQAQDWFSESWGFAKQILPLLLFGVLIAGLLLGRPDKEGLIPNAWIAWALGGNSIGANALASVAGAFMYFATLTEVPIVQGLVGSGMGKGPALALLLAGPALSLPSMLVINSVMGFRKTAVFIILVCALSTIAGVMFGAIVD